MRIIYKCKLDILEKAEYWMIGQICVIKTGGLLSRAKKGIEPLLRQINFLLDPSRLLSLVEIEAFLGQFNVSQFSNWQQKWSSSKL